MNLIHYERTYLFGSIFWWLNGIGGALAAVFELPVALIELNYHPTKNREDYNMDKLTLSANLT